MIGQRTMKNISTFLNPLKENSSKWKVVETITPTPRGGENTVITITSTGPCSSGDIRKLRECVENCSLVIKKNLMPRKFDKTIKIDTLSCGHLMVAATIKYTVSSLQLQANGSTPTKTQ